VLGLDAPVLLGHSAGGFVALHAALRAPGAFGGLILCNTSAALIAEPDPTAPTLLERGGAVAAAVAGRVFAGDLSPDVADDFARLVAPYYAGPTHVDVPGRLFPLSPPSIDLMRHFFSGEAQRYDVRDRLSEIAVPTLVIAGRYDWVCPPAASRTIAAAIPGADLVILDDAGHFSFSEEPDLFHDAVRAFLQTAISSRTRSNLCAPLPESIPDVIQQEGDQAALNQLDRDESLGPAGIGGADAAGSARPVDQRAHRRWCPGSARQRLRVHRLVGLVRRQRCRHVRVGQERLGRILRHWALRHVRIGHDGRRGRITHARHLPVRRGRQPSSGQWVEPARAPTVRRRRIHR
jgi:predicted alpha/beta hydrolase family esterase